MTGKELISWIVVVFNPVIVGATFPIPVVQYGKISWGLVIAGFLMYTLLWMLIWYRGFEWGKRLYIKEG